MPMPAREISVLLRVDIVDYLVDNLRGLVWEVPYHLGSDSWN
jgi:hypothetical protein